MDTDTINVDSLVRLFRVYLNNSWEVVSKFSKYFPEKNQKGFFNNFRQSAWEMLVEMPFFLPPKFFLEVYGEGSKLNAPYRRIWNPEINATYRVICKVNKTVMNYNTSKFVDFKEGVFYKFINEDLMESPPFNIVVVLDKYNNEFAFNVGDITFDLEKINDSLR